MAQGLLGRDTGDLIQPTMVWILFKPSQGSAGVFVEEVFPALTVGIRTQAQAKVVHKTRTAEGAGQHLVLARSWVAAIAVGAFLFHKDLFFLSPTKPVSERRARLLPIPSTGWVSAAQKIYDLIFAVVQLIHRAFGGSQVC